MTMPAAPPGIYHSRSRTTRNRAALAAAGLSLLLIGYAIGRWQDSPAVPTPAAAAGVAVTSSAPSPATTPPSEAPPSAPPAPVGGVDAYAPIQAEGSTNQQGTDTQDTQDEGGGRNVGWVSNGDWLQYDQVNFGTAPATRFTARVASEVGDGVIGQLDIRIDSPSATPVGSLRISNTGGWQTWQSQTTITAPVTGLHTVFLTFTGPADTEFLNLNYFTFGH
ncbi:carbohydrate-binding protein [Actinoplanes sp. NPDC051859]|uniref:carbohydrate-binding protein n=1 Tax=Actinoplanes sp. NPDC051859 TaxID=3363909 RepID=UPI003791F9BC